MTENLYERHLKPHFRARMKMKNDLFNLERRSPSSSAAPASSAARWPGAGRGRARVAVVGRNEERGKERVRAIESAGGRAIFHAADALDRDCAASASATPS